MGQDHLAALVLMLRRLGRAFVCSGIAALAKELREPTVSVPAVARDSGSSIASSKHREHCQLISLVLAATSTTGHESRFTDPILQSPHGAAQGVTAATTRREQMARQLIKRIVIVAAAAVAAGNTLELEVRDVDVPAGPRELHQRYSEIFRYGNRNAALATL